MIGALVAGITGSGGASLSSYESIATATATGGETSITLNIGSGSFKHLQIRGITRDTHTSGLVRSLHMRFNSDTGSNYARHYLSGNGTAASAGGTASSTFMSLWSCAPDDGSTANIFGAIDVTILDYASTSKYKTLRGFTGADLNGSGNVNVVSGLWMSTSAITSIQIIAEAVAFKAGSSFALYGIKEA
jgi:hypothetical protein